MNNNVKENKLMKDGLNEAAICRISNGLSAVLPNFEASEFERLALSGLDRLELKERVEHIIKALDVTIDDPFKRLVKPLCSLPDRWDYGNPNDSTRSFAAWPIIDFVAVKGANEPKLAMRVFEAITHLNSAEFAIRYFIVHHYDVTFKTLLKWCDHKKEHVRRLASEGCRPRLPWGIQLKQFIEDPLPLFHILEKLRLDESQYVKRSVANNLNDISKDHPELVLERLKQWRSTDEGESDWVIRHACRSLIKQGHPKSFVLLGYTEKPKVSCGNLVCDKKVKIGQILNFSFLLNSEKNKQKVVVDYAIDFMKANGKTSRKVFKLKNLEINKGEEIDIAKSHSFKLISTRKYYAGKHHLAILVNGEEVAEFAFELLK